MTKVELIEQKIYLKYQFIQLLQAEIKELEMRRRAIKIAELEAIKEADEIYAGKPL
jgi:hypothetical protein